MDNTQEYTCLSLCSGYGGLELGLKRACPNIRTVAYVEVEAYAVANLVSKMEKGVLDAAPIWTDIKTFNAEPFRDRIYFVTAGYPCQGESTAGKRLGKTDPRWLWPYIERIIEAVRPVWFFGENVEGHLTIGYPTVYRSLRNLGYKVEAGLFTASECGAPHRRKRLFVLAHNHTRGRKTIPILQKGQPTTPYRCRKLADSECSKQGQGIIKETQTEGRRDRFTIEHWPARPGQPQYKWEEPRVISNPKSNRQQRPRARKQTNNLGKLLQKESPRVVADTGKKQTGRLSQPKERQQNKKAGSAGRQGQTQSRLGRAAYGSSGRVDRLRLLGNGVVPQQAEKAFKTLIKNFEKEANK